jgi:hypothetical protein
MARATKIHGLIKIKDSNRFAGPAMVRFSQFGAWAHVAIDNEQKIRCRVISTWFDEV